MERKFLGHKIGLKESWPKKAQKVRNEKINLMCVPFFSLLMGSMMVGAIEFDVSRHREHVE